MYFLWHISVKCTDEANIFTGRHHDGITILFKRILTYYIILFLNFLLKEKDLFIHNIYMLCDTHTLYKYLAFNHVMSSLCVSLMLIKSDMIHSREWIYIMRCQNRISIYQFGGWLLSYWPFCSTIWHIFCLFGWC